MKITELISMLAKLCSEYGDLTVGYDSGVMKFNGLYTVEERDKKSVISLEGEYG